MGGKTSEKTPHPDYLVHLLETELAEELEATEPSTLSDQEWLKNQCFTRSTYLFAL